NVKATTDKAHTPATIHMTITIRGHRFRNHFQFCHRYSRGSLDPIDVIANHGQCNTAISLTTPAEVNTDMGTSTAVHGYAKICVCAKNRQRGNGTVSIRNARESRPL
ncbi:hypothetical protein SK128_005513, partial [Halocaridina rubra]